MPEKHWVASSMGQTGWQVDSTDLRPRTDSSQRRLRNPYEGVILAGEGQEHIRCVIGPLAAQVAGDMESFMKSLVEQEAGNRRRA